MNIKEILESSGWQTRELKEGLEYQIPLTDVKFYYVEAGDKSAIYSKKKYKNSKLWGAKQLIKEDSPEAIGSYLAENGLLNENEYKEKRRQYILEEEEKKQKLTKRQKSNNKNKIERKVITLGRHLYNASKKVMVMGVVLVGGYTSYHYIENKVDPAALYTYVKKNVGNYEIKDILTNEAVSTLTYSQIRNIDYAIENDQVEELLNKIEDVPENINYISVLKENIKESNN